MSNTTDSLAENVPDFLKDSTSGGAWGDHVEDEELEAPISRPQEDSSQHETQLSETQPPSQRGNRPRPTFEKKVFSEDNIPTQPPFVMYLGNLSYTSRRDDILRVFQDLNPINYTIPSNKERTGLAGYGYLMFDSREALKAALDRQGIVVVRPLRTDVVLPDRLSFVVERMNQFQARKRDRATRNNDRQSPVVPDTEADSAQSWRGLKKAPPGRRNNNNNKPSSESGEKRSSTFGTKKPSDQERTPRSQKNPQRSPSTETPSSEWVSSPTSSSRPQRGGRGGASRGGRRGGASRGGRNTDSTPKVDQDLANDFKNMMKDTSKKSTNRSSGSRKSKSDAHAKFGGDMFE